MQGHSGGRIAVFMASIIDLGVEEALDGRRRCCHSRSVQRRAVC